jgi:hypothetical protein
VKRIPIAFYPVILLTEQFVSRNEEVELELRFVTDGALVTGDVHTGLHARPKTPPHIIISL